MIMVSHTSVINIIKIRLCTSYFPSFAAFSSSCNTVFKRDSIIARYSFVTIYFHSFLYCLFDILLHPAHHKHSASCQKGYFSVQTPNIIIPSPLLFSRNPWIFTGFRCCILWFFIPPCDIVHACQQTEPIDKIKIEAYNGNKPITY